MSEERQNKKDKFEIDLSLIYTLLEPSDLKDVPEIARFCGKSKSWVNDKIKNDLNFPVCNLFGRIVFATQTSLNHYMKNNSGKSESRKPSKIDVIHWTGQN